MLYYISAKQIIVDRQIVLRDAPVLQSSFGHCEKNMWNFVQFKNPSDIGLVFDVVTFL